MNIIRPPYLEAPLILIIFDFDGTLATLPVDWQAMKRQLAGHFRTSRVGSVDFTTLNAGLVTVREQLGQGALLEAYGIIESFEHAALPLLQPQHQVLDVFRRAVANGKRTAVFSNNMTSTIQKGLLQLGISELVTMIVSKDSVAHYKPHPEGLFKILSSLKIDMTNAIFVGDSAADQEAATSAGIQFILANHLNRCDLA